jgi:hypothetical protein
MMQQILLNMRVTSYYCIKYKKKKIPLPYHFAVDIFAVFKMLGKAIMTASYFLDYVMAFKRNAFSTQLKGTHFAEGVYLHVGG